jgi:predicted nucleotidyltransferase
MLAIEGFKPETKTKIINLCKAIIPHASIGIYGSRARGDYSERSDLDIVLEGDKPISYFDIAELKDVLSAANLPCSVDIVDINAIQDEDFKTNIKKERIIWQK